MQIRNNFLYFLLCTLTLASMTYAKEEAEATPESTPLILNYPARTYAQHTEGNWLDNHDGYTTIGAFSTLPFLKKCGITSFTDLRVHFFNHGKVAANVGIGFRYEKKDCPKDCYRILGVNAYYDYRGAGWNHNYHQVGIGFEYLTSSADFRLNTYLPIDAKSHSHTDRFAFGDGLEATFQRERAAYGGFDAEFGVWLRRQSTCRFFDLYAAFGGYYYAPKKHFQYTEGFKARIATRFMRYFVFELKGGYDVRQRGMLQGTLSAAIPLDALFNKCGLCCAPKDTCCQNDWLYQPVNRQDIIALSPKQCHWTWNWDTPTTSCNTPCCR